MPREPVDDDDLIRLLLEIQRMALSKYPFTPEDGPLDSDLLVELGRIGGMCAGAVDRHRAKQRLL